MTNDRYYVAKHWAHDVDHHHESRTGFNQKMMDILYGTAIEKDEFMDLAAQAGIDLSMPDARSERPHPVLYWDVDLPTHVMLARDGERDNFWAFTKHHDEAMQLLREAFEQSRDR